jgi:Flp pilus assembly protein TadB
MKQHDRYFLMSAIFLLLTIGCQTYSILSVRSEFILLGIFSAFLSWIFMIRAKKALVKEFQQLEEVLDGKEK